jgi:hypothetical protein
VKTHFLDIEDIEVVLAFDDADGAYVDEDSRESGSRTSLFGK